MSEFLAVGVAELHLSLSDFWSLTLAQYLVFLQKKKDEDKRQDTIFGNMIANIHTIAANWGKGPNDAITTFSPTEFRTFEYGKMGKKGYISADGSWVSEADLVASQERVKQIAGV